MMDMETHCMRLVSDKDLFLKSPFTNVQSEAGLQSVLSNYPVRRLTGRAL